MRTTNGIETKYKYNCVRVLDEEQHILLTNAFYISLQRDKDVYTLMKLIDIFLTLHVFLKFQIRSYPIVTYLNMSLILCYKTITFLSLEQFLDFPIFVDQNSAIEDFCLGDNSLAEK